MRIPKYRRQRSKHGDRAFVEHKGQRIYLGPYDSQESRDKYDRFVDDLHIERIADARQAGKRHVPAEVRDHLIDDLLDRYFTHLETKLSPTSPQMYLTTGLIKLLAPYIDWRISNFGPQACLGVRDTMLKETTWTYKTINDQMSRLVRIWKWGVERELVPVDCHLRLAAIEPLKAKDVKEDRRGKKVKSVAWTTVQKIRRHVSPTIWDMVQVQRWTGMRSDELCSLCLADLDRSGDVWVYTKQHHKTEHHGKEKIVMIGPKAQKVLIPRLLAAKEHPDGLLFTPEQSWDEHQAARAASRKTPKYGQQATRGKKARSDLRPRFTKDSYYRAIQRGIERARAVWSGKHDDATEEDVAAAIPSWHPHQLRHTWATKAREKFGVEGAASVTGNTITAAQIYAEVSKKLAAKIAKEMG